MTKETKQDRAVRLMMEQMTEHLVELREFEKSPHCKETDVERWAQSLLKTCLGYTVSNGYSIKAQEQKNKMRPDLVVYKGDKPIFVMEIKKLGFDFEKSDFRSGKLQLKEYLATFEDVPYGFLCNGHEWRLFDFTNKQCPIEIQKIDVKESMNAWPDFSKKDAENICYDFTSFHEYAFSSSEWQDLSKEATAFSPDSLAKAILTPNVMKTISKEIRGEHEYKACTDLLFDKVYHLIANGLDDTLKASYNPEKKAEFEKYIKAQKRLARKTKRVVKTASEAPSMEVSETPEVAEQNKEVA